MKGSDWTSTSEDTTINHKPPLAALTGLRFVAAFFVLCFHNGFTRLDGVPRPLRNLAEQGYLSVSLFFVLSGFILTYNYARADGSAIDARKFRASRAARIYPVYLFALLLAAPFFLEQIISQSWPAALALVVGGLMVLCLVQAWTPQTIFLWNYPAWSLSNEAFFYTLYPRLLHGLQRISTRRLLAAIPLLWLLSQTPLALFLWRGSQTELSDDSQFFGQMIVSGNPLLRLPEFVLGMVLGLWYLRDGITLRSSRRTCWLAASLGMTAGALALAVIMETDRWPTFMRQNHNLLAPLFGVLIIGLAFETGPLARLLSTRWMVLLGDASYGLYILHVPVLRGLHRFAAWLSDDFTPYTWSFCLLSTVVAVGFSVATYLLLERPAVPWLRERLLNGWIPGSVREPTAHLTARGTRTKEIIAPPAT